MLDYNAAAHRMQPLSAKVAAALLRSGRDYDTLLKNKVFTRDTGEDAMIRKTENDSGLTFFLGNERLSCLMKLRWGKLQLLHMGAPVLPEDADAMCCSTLFGWGNDVLYSQEDNGSSLDTMPLAW
ncbi:MAG: hypothetical protein J6T26_07650, partial [Firmicutes bacterium]|nr:hypothetical protein [Bacillota bacterium]